MKEYILIQNDEQTTFCTPEGTPLAPTTLLNDCGDKRVFALHGQMGAGKTTFIKALCADMGVQDTVNSPTFAIVNVYEDQTGKEIYHFDCYRLKDKTEAMDFGAEEYLYSGNYCFVEWPDIIEDMLPEDTVHVEIEILPDGNRKLRIA